MCCLNLNTRWKENISHLSYNLKHLRNVNLFPNWLDLLTVHNLFPLEVVQKSQYCQICVLREKSIVRQLTETTVRIINVMVNLLFLWKPFTHIQFIILCSSKNFCSGCRIIFLCCCFRLQTECKHIFQNVYTNRNKIPICFPESLWKSISAGSKMNLFLRPFEFFRKWIILSDLPELY